MAAPFAVMGYGSLIQRTDFRVREVDLAIPGLPGDLENLRILQLSDIPLRSERFGFEPELTSNLRNGALQYTKCPSVITAGLIQKARRSDS